MTTLIDRHRELNTILEWLHRSDLRLLTITGAGGSGKSRLAIAAASEAATGFPHGTAFVDLSSVVDPGLVAPTIARSFGLRDMGLEPLLAQLVRLLEQARLLLVLDNFEQVVAAAPVLGELLGACPGIKILVTSRVRLRVTGERELPLGPLALENHSGEAFAQGDAVQLFVERAQAVKPEFAVTSANLPAVVEIVRRLDGLPLAIELAAVRVRALTPVSLLQRMETRLPLLTGGSRDLPARQQTMRDAIAWSFDLLQAQEQALFCQLAVFADGFTLRAAQAISADEEDSSEILERLAILIDHSLVSPVSGSRYHFLETVREFAWERLVERGDALRVQRRHADYFLSLATSSTLDAAGQAPSALLDRLGAEHANFRVTFAWLLDHDIEQALQLATALRSYWRIRGHLGEGAAILERALAAEGGSPAARASALVALASIRNLQADYESATALAEQARDLSASIGDQRGVAEALRRVAPAYIALGLATDPPDLAHFAHAATLWEDELALRRELHDRSGIAWAVMNIGVPALAARGSARATAQFEAAIPLLEDVGDEYGVAIAYGNLARAVAIGPDTVRAAMLFTEAIRRTHALGDQWGIAHLVENIAWLIASQGLADHAARLLGAAAALREADQIRGTGLGYAGHEQAVTAACSALGQAQFDALFEAGRRLRLDEVVTETLVALGHLQAGQPDRPADHPGGATPEASPADVSRLSPREAEVLRLLAAGLSNTDIAAHLYISPKTVSSHLVRVYAKLGVTTRTAAVRLAMEQGLT